jgi:hypothetical protein
MASGKRAAREGLRRSMPHGKLAEANRPCEVVVYGFGGQIAERRIYDPDG